MKNWIPFEKLSKKKQRELNAGRRSDWGSINPVTRRPENPKAYNRRKAQKWKDDFHDCAFCYIKLNKLDNMISLSLSIFKE